MRMTDRPADTRPTLIGYLPPPEGIRKTGANYPVHSRFINTGDMAYTHAGAKLTSGRHFSVWDFRMSAEEVSEKFSRVLFFIPCRIAPPPHDNDGYAYEFVTRFIERLKIPFFSLSESIQTNHYEYEPDFHRSLSPKVTRYLKTVADKSPFVGTRGNYSAEVLTRLGIKNAMPLGCPSLYLNGPQLRESLLQVPANPEKIAVCYSNYQGNQNSRIVDFLQFANQNGYYYVEQTFGLVTQALYYPGKITGTDIYAAKKIYQNFAPLISLLKKGQVRYFTNYELWRSFLGSMDFVFGARMHGLTPALHAGKPAVFIAHDARVREMCEFFSLPFVAERELPDQMNLEFFLSRCNYAPTRKRYHAANDDYTRLLRRHGLDGNLDSHGNIIDDWTPEPDPQVAAEESPPYLDPAGITNLEQQIAIFEQIPDDTFSKLAKIRHLAQAWYLSRTR